ncbi:MAG: hypothetical protein ACK5HJ_05345 [Bacteroidota bacterium]
MDTKQIELIIKTKIDAITDLPDDYQPNLDSKWETLRIAIQPKRKQRLYYISIAASIALVMMAGFYILEDNRTTTRTTRTKLHNKAIESQKIFKEDNIKPAVAFSNNIANKQERQKTTPELSHPDISMHETCNNVIVENDSVNPSFSKRPEIVAVNNKKRFIEIDFGSTDNDTNHIIKSVANTNDYQFNIGTRNQLNQHPNKSNDNVLIGTAITVSFISK